MLITPRFTFLHLPKTGGTFVTEMLKQTYGSRLAAALPDGAVFRINRHLRQHSVKAVSASMALRVLGYAETEKHAGRLAIPRFAADRAIVGCIRDPFARYASMYEFGFWRLEELRTDLWAVEAIGRFPHFPDISFEEFVEVTRIMARIRASALGIVEEVGIQSLAVMEFYRTDASAYAGATTDTAIARLAEDLASVELLHTERLGDDLAAFLSRQGVDRDSTVRVRQTAPILPISPSGRRRTAGPDTYFTQDLFDLVRGLERVILGAMPDYDRSAA